MFDVKLSLFKTIGFVLGGGGMNLVTILDIILNQGIKARTDEGTHCTKLNTRCGIVPSVGSDLFLTETSFYSVLDSQLSHFS